MITEAEAPASVSLSYLDWNTGRVHNTIVCLLALRLVRIVFYSQEEIDQSI